MWSAFSFILLVGYLPGAILFRLPFGRRDLRAGLTAEERVFWHVILSVAFTSGLGLALAAAGWYRFDLLLWSIAVVVVLLVVVFRSRLRLGPATPLPRWSAIIPIAILAATAFVTLSTPPAEYIIGGKDPGTYINEGIQIAQRGSLTIRDPLIASIPDHLLPLVARESRLESAYGNRFMGFYLIDPAEGRVMGQFPHLYPVWIAIAYGVHGLTGARYVVTLLAVLGVLAVYFAGVWILGRRAAAAGALLLAVNVAHVWYSRYPNAEILLQVLVFSSILAVCRASAKKDPFFAAVAGVLVTLAGFAHLTGVFVIGFAFVAGLLGQFAQRRPPFAFFLTALAGGVAVILYYSVPLEPYMERYLIVIRSFRNLIPWTLIGGTVLLMLLAMSRTRMAPAVRRWLPPSVVGGVWALAIYAYFFRFPEGRLAPHDAAALRTFSEFYLSPLGLIMALAGLAVVARRRFWPSLCFVLLLIGFSLVFFYKIRVFPEHFWAARRFLAVVLPGSCLLIGAAAFPLRWPSVNLRAGRLATHVALVALGMALVVHVGTDYLRASMLIRNHIEYEDLVPRVEAIRDLINDTDLVLVESRQASDLHTLALPLAYIYARQVLVLASADPDKAALRELLSWARARYERVLFMGGGGTLLVSRSIAAIPVATDRFSVPEYESAHDAYPTEVRFKRYDVALYRLIPRLKPIDQFALDVGINDELWLRRFHDQEVLGGTDVAFRWSRDVSFVTLLGVSRDRRVVTLWLSNGGRPDSAGAATVEVALDDLALGRVTLTDRFEPYQFEIPVDLAAAMEIGEDPGRLRLISNTWKPGAALGVDDPRELGVMLDRVTLE